MTRMVIGTATLLLSLVAQANPGALEQALSKVVGLQEPRIERDRETLRVAFKYGGKPLDEPVLRKALLGAMVAIRDGDAEIKRAVLDVEFKDGQVLQVTGDPIAFRTEMDEVGFLRAARIRFRTRGPAVTPGPCPKKTTCKRDPERCPCEPGSVCEPEEKAADVRGCLAVRTPRNAETSGARAACKPDHTWDQDGQNCVPAPECGEAVEQGGACICPPGVENNPSGGCGPVPGAAPDAGPASQPASQPAASSSRPTTSTKAPATPVGPGDTAFPRWVWQAIAVGVGLSLPIALFLFGSIISGLRSKRSRIGVGTFCVQCGRKLAMEDTVCSKCRTQQP